MMRPFCFVLMPFGRRPTSARNLRLIREARKRRGETVCRGLPTSSKY